LSPIFKLGCRMIKLTSCSRTFSAPSSVTSQRDYSSSWDQNFMFILRWKWAPKRKRTVSERIIIRTTTSKKIKKTLFSFKKLFLLF
jgi:hypothetical protein